MHISHTHTLALFSVWLFVGQQIMQLFSIAQLSSVAQALMNINNSTEAALQLEGHGVTPLAVYPEVSGAQRR